MFDYLNNLLVKNLEKFKWINRAISIACIYLLYLLLVDKEFTLNWSWDFLSISLIILIGYLFNSVSWSLIIDNKIKKEKISSWFLSLIGKYFPFKLGIPLMRVSKDAQNTKVDTKTYFFGVIYEVLYQIITGGSIVTIYLIARFYNLPFTLLISIFFFILFLAYKISSSIKPFILLSTCLGYTMFIIAIDLLVRQIGHDSSLDIAMAYIASSIISLLFVGAPAGIGVREYLFIFFFQSQENLVEVDFLQVAFLLRIIFIFTDVLGYALFKLLEFKDSQKF